MNTSFRRFFPVISLARVLGILLIFLLGWLWDLNSPYRTAFPDFKIHIQFSAWEYLLMYSIAISFLANTIISLLISFRPRWSFSAFLQYKSIPLFFYIVELLVLPFLVYASYKKVQDIFFPPTNALNEILKYILPTSSATSVYEKYETVNMVFLVVTSLCFVLCFWKYYMTRKTELETTAL